MLVPADARPRVADLTLLPGGRGSVEGWRGGQGVPPILVHVAEVRSAGPWSLSALVRTEGYLRLLDARMYGLEGTRSDRALILSPNVCS